MPGLGVLLRSLSSLHDGYPVVATLQALDAAKATTAHDDKDGLHPLR